MARGALAAVSLVLLRSLVACSGGGDPGDEGARPARPVALHVAGPDAVTLGLEERYRIDVQVTYADTGEPAPGRIVGFALEGDRGGAILSWSRVASGDDGRARGELVSGPAPGSFRVVATTRQAEAAGADPRVSVAIRVDAVYRGRLEVDFRYDVPVSVGVVSTRVHAGTRDCASIGWPVRPPGDATLEATGPDDAVFFEGLADGAVYTVTALAEGLAGQPVATGCAVAPAIVGRGTVGITLPLVPLPPTVAGEYEFGARLALAEALPGDVGFWVRELDGFLHDPAGLVAELVVDQLAEHTGVSSATAALALSLAWAVYACPAGSPPGCTPDLDGDGSLVDDAVGNLLFDRLYHTAPWLRDGLALGGDLTGLLSDLAAGGVLHLESAGPDGTLDGHWDWSDFLFTWRLGTGCDPADACCGRTVFSGAQMGLAPVGADLAATLAPLDTLGRIELALDVPEQALDLQYGRVVRFAIERVLLPAVTGQTSFACAMESWIGCDLDDAHYRCCDGSAASCPTTAEGLAAGDACGCQRAGERIYDALGGSVLGLEPAVWAGLCRLGLLGTGAVVDGMLAQLATSGTGGDSLRLGMHGVLADDDHDLRVDLVEATASGTVVAGGAGASFGGPFTAALRRTLCRADRDCRSWEACRVEPDPLDGCAARPAWVPAPATLPASRGVCEQRVGRSRGGAPCTWDEQCRSGTCLPDHRCLELCVTAEDCAAGLACRPGVLVPLVQPTASSAGLSLPFDACR